VIVLLDDVDLLPMTGDVLLRLRACAAGSIRRPAVCVLVAASSSLFHAVRSAPRAAHWMFEPLSPGPLDPPMPLGRHRTSRRAPVSSTENSFRRSSSSPAVDLLPPEARLLRLRCGDRRESDPGRVPVAFSARCLSQRGDLRRSVSGDVSDRSPGRGRGRTGTEPTIGDIEPRRRGSGGGRRGPPSAASPAAAGHIDRLASSRRGRYTVQDQLFQRCRLQTCEP
jgi:hypothetical protein